MSTTLDALDPKVAAYIANQIAAYRRLVPTGQTTCPRCKGDGGKVGFGFVTRDSESEGGCGIEPISCMTCAGSGQVDGNFRARCEIGESIRDIRLAGDYSLREFARMVGLTAVELGAVERGRTLA